jgi:ERCC4-related helicase
MRFIDKKNNILTRFLIATLSARLEIGLGKTMIAAVVMLNYYRWFPESKVVFMAPTRPLVAQQQEACYKIAGMSPDDTAVFVGSGMNPVDRAQAWVDKRVFFATPQNVQNDLQRGICPGNNIVLLVIDEAHRATGNYAYTVVIREMLQHHVDFRVLALSATPGSRKDQVQEVISGLLISRIEIRTEESPDLLPYTFRRKKDVITVKMHGTAKLVQDKFYAFMIPMIQRLTRAKGLHIEDPEVLTPFLVLDSMKRFQQISPNARIFSSDFLSLHKLCSLADTLATQSLLSFYFSLRSLPQDIQSGQVRPLKPLIQLIQSSAFHQLLEQLRQYVEEDPNFVSHPKQVELERIVLEHFLDQQESNSSHKCSKVMIFAKFRGIVEEINKVLSKHHPMVRVMSFFGQSKGKSGTRGLNQKEQMNIIRKFQSGGYNTLVSTSVGEEGLDIGDVDLIICYDSSQSPVQMLQRMGRTGRKREGRVVCLLTSGREEMSYKKSQNKYKVVQNLIQASRGAFNQLVFHDNSPRMLPWHVKPVCLRMRINIPLLADINGPLGMAKGSSDKHAIGPFLNSDEMIDYVHKFQSSLDPAFKFSIVINKYIEEQVIPRPGKIVGLSETSNRFFSILETLKSIEGKRLESSARMSQSTYCPPLTAKIDTSLNSKTANVTEIAKDKNFHGGMNDHGLDPSIWDGETIHSSLVHQEAYPDDEICKVNELGNLRVMENRTDQTSDRLQDCTSDIEMEFDLDDFEQDIMDCSSKNITGDVPENSTAQVIPWFPSQLALEICPSPTAMKSVFGKRKPNSCIAHFSEFLKNLPESPCSNFETGAKDSQSLGLSYNQHGFNKIPFTPSDATQSIQSAIS